APAAAPLSRAPPGVFPKEKRGLDKVRWRHRHYRDFFRRERGDTVGRSGADAFSSSTPARGLTSSVAPPSTSSVPPPSSEIFRLNPPRRRGWVDPPPPR